MTFRPLPLFDLRKRAEAEAIQKKWDRAFCLGGHCLRFSTEDPRPMLLSATSWSRSVVYLNFEDHRTEPHGSWLLDETGKHMIISFHHWGDETRTRFHLLERVPRENAVEESREYWPSVHFRGVDYLRRGIEVRLRFPPPGGSARTICTSTMRSCGNEIWRAWS